MMASVDYSKPLSTLLRESTHEVHVSVQTSAGAKLLLSGGLAREEYARYLMMLWHIYDALERALERHANHPALEPTYNPILLARAPLLVADISHLLDVSESSWKFHPIYRNLLADFPSPLSDYVQRIEEISNSEDPSILLAHSYVRYLGDLSGGQVIRHTLAKAYDLDEVAGYGIAFYSFKELRSSKPTTSQDELKKIKNWFRDGMNSTGGNNVEFKAAVLKESNKAFLFNVELFTTLILEKQVEESKEILGKGTLTADAAYPLSQILALVGAACLAHFILVVGGFTGNGGYQKLLAVQQWLTELW